LAGYYANRAIYAARWKPRLRSDWQASNHAGMDILQLFEENFRFFASFVALLIEGSVVMIATIRS